MHLCGTAGDTQPGPHGCAGRLIRPLPRFFPTLGREPVGQPLIRSACRGGRRSGLSDHDSVEIRVCDFVFLSWRVVGLGVGPGKDALGEQTPPKSLDVRRAQPDQWRHCDLQDCGVRLWGMWRGSEPVRSVRSRAAPSRPPRLKAQGDVEVQRPGHVCDPGARYPDAAPGSAAADS